MKQRLSRGFTLVELILVMALMAVIFGLTIPLSFSYLTRHDLAAATQKTVQLTRRASLLAAAGQFDSAWGVEIAGGKITLFKGTVFSSRDQAYDEVYTYPTDYTLSGSTEFIFSKLTGRPVSAGAITFTTPENATATVTINSLGTVEY